MISIIATSTATEEETANFSSTIVCVCVYVHQIMNERDCVPATYYTTIWWYIAISVFRFYENSIVTRRA